MEYVDLMRIATLIVEKEDELVIERIAMFIEDQPELCIPKQFITDALFRNKPMAPTKDNLCGRCFGKITDEYRYCPNCGQRIERSKEHED